MYKYYLLDPNDFNNCVYKVMHNQQKLINMEAKAGQLKLMNDLNDKISVKNIKL